MAIDGARIVDLFTRLGELLKNPTTLCLIGSTPGIATGQGNRQTPDIDVWHARSAYDAPDLARACEEAGLLFDPKGDLDPEAMYIQVVRPGIVKLPREFELEIIGRYGNLTVVMPPPEIIAAAKLVRGSEVDFQDVAWWVGQRGLDASDIEAAIDLFPNPRDREAARENIVVVSLVADGHGR